MHEYNLNNKRTKIPGTKIPGDEISGIRSKRHILIPPSECSKVLRNG